MIVSLYWKGTFLFSTNFDICAKLLNNLFFYELLKKFCGKDWIPKVFAVTGLKRIIMGLSWKNCPTKQIIINFTNIINFKCVEGF